MSWIELALNKSKWVIKFKWQAGKLFFNNEWFKFTDSIKLKEGDMCVIVRTSNFQKFNVAIFEKNERHHLSANGKI